MATVADYQQQASEAAADTLAKAESFLAELSGAAQVVFSDPGFNIDAIVPNSYDYATVPDIYIPQFVTGGRPTVEIAGNAVAPELPTLPTIPDLSAIAVPEDDLLAPTNEFEFYESAYQSILLDPLKAKLLNDLLYGGYGIDTDDEAALYNRIRDRESETAMTRIDEAGRALAARGFPLPPGELSVAIDRAHQEFQSKVSSASREIFVNAAARFVENRKFTIQEVRQLETVLIGFHNSVQERALNVAKATAEFAIQVYNVGLERFKTRMQGAQIANEIQVAQVRVYVERVRAAIELFRGQIDAYTANIRNAAEASRLRIELYRADIENDRNLHSTQVAQAQLRQKAIEAATSQNILTNQVTIAAAQAKLTATAKALEFQLKAAEFGAEKFFATLTAMYGSINSLAVQSKEE